MNNVGFIVKKELKRVFSDRKMVISLFILPVIVMVVIYAVLGNMIDSFTNDIETHAGTVVIENAPDDFKEYLTKCGYNGKIDYISSDDKNEDYKNQIKEGKLDMLVVFDQEFQKLITDYQQGAKIPEVKTYYNPSEEYSSSVREEFLQTVLTGYRNQYLVSRFNSMEAVTVFQVDQDEASSQVYDDNKANGKVLGRLIPYLLTFLLFSSAMGLCVDAITGEKERGTMASLLITPVKRKDIVLGKIIGLSILSICSAAVYAVAMIVSLPFTYGKAMGGTEGGMISFNFVQGVELFFIVIALAYLYVVIICLISVFAKNVKEATSYVMPIYMVVLLLGMITMFQGGTGGNDLLYGIPIYGTAKCIQNLLTNELHFFQFFINIGITVIIATILTAFVTKAFNSEKVMLNA